MNLKNNELPVVVKNDIAPVPGTTMHFSVEKEKYFKAIEVALKNKSQIIIFLNNKPKEGSDIGVLADVSQIVKSGKDIMRVLVDPKKRILIEDTRVEDGIIYASYSDLPDSVPENDYEIIGMILALRDLFSSYAISNEHINPDMRKKVDECTDFEKIIDYITANVPFDIFSKIDIVKEPDAVVRYNLLTTFLVEDIKISRVKKEIFNLTKEKIDKSQKEFYLREQMAVIKEELGDDANSRIEDFMEQAEELDAPQSVKDHIIEEIKHMESIMSSSQEMAVTRSYVELLLALPWNKKSKDNNDINRVKEILDRDHYGMVEVKERIMETLAVRALNADSESPIICLVGPPGTGKTSIAKSVAEALNRKYVRICLGGMRDEAEIRGHRKTYIGAMPGRIVSALKKTQTSNPLMLLDEIDKVSSDYKGDVHSALLEVLDPEQNTYFTDHYTEVPVDLSDVLFICTANTTDTIPGPLLDRMEIIDVSGYTSNEKYHIASDHLIPRQIKKNGLKKSWIKISDDAIKDIIMFYTRESGVRGLEKRIGKICRKTAKLIVSGERKSVSISSKNLENYLGKRIYRNDEISGKNDVGIVRGLAWTSCGGETLEFEVNVMTGKGECELTGRLGDVMRESAKTAISYVRSQSEKYGLETDFFEKHDIHIHIPEGAVPKDGPSAGITMATAILSAVTGHAVYSDVAMTGEITLRGRVLPIGGLKEKLIAAKNAGVKTVLVPDDNRRDVADIDNEITEGIGIVYVNNMEQVLDKAFVG